MSGRFPDFGCRSALPTATSGQSPAVRGTPFEPLTDESLFRQVRVDLGAVTWPTGADLAPDAMYDAIRASGEWILE